MKKTIFILILFIPFIIMSALAFAVGISVHSEPKNEIFMFIIGFLGFIFTPIWVHYLDSKGYSEKIIDILGKTEKTFDNYFQTLVYTADFLEDRGVNDEGIELIMKPIRPYELLCKIREMLDK